MDPGLDLGVTGYRPGGEETHRDEQVPVSERQRVLAYRHLVTGGEHAVNGDFEALREGFAAIGMPQERWAEASAIVREVLDANGASGFRWYKPDRTDELACTWVGVGQNALWIAGNNVHVSPATTGVTLPSRPLTYSKENGAVGWLLPGASTGTGGGRRRPGVRWIACPVTQELQPAGSECPDCSTVHDA